MQGLLAVCEKGEVMEFIKKNLLAVIVAGAAVLALILGIVLPGATAEYMGQTNNMKLFDVVFGVNETVMGTKMTGAMSIFGLVSIAALVAGIVLTILSIFKGEKLGFIGAILVAVAGVCMFLLLVAGTNLVYTAGGQVVSTAKFTEAYELYKLGIGAIIYAILAILGGGFAILNKFKKII